VLMAEKRDRSQEDKKKNEDSLVHCHRRFLLPDGRGPERRAAGD
jgi:hypothetical protein